jgi:hypothetical protein
MPENNSKQFLCKEKINPDYNSKRGGFWVHMYIKTKTNETQDSCKIIKTKLSTHLNFHFICQFFFAKLKLAIFAECCNHKVRASNKHCCWPNALMSTSYNKFQVKGGPNVFLAYEIE